MGHLDQQRFNGWSTQPRPRTPTKIEPTSEDILARQHDAAPAVLESPAQKSHHIYVDCQESTGELYTDSTCCFLQRSILSGNTTVRYDTNYVHDDTMENEAGPQCYPGSIQNSTQNALSQNCLSLTMRHRERCKNSWRTTRSTTNSPPGASTVSPKERESIVQYARKHPTREKISIRHQGGQADVSVCVLGAHRWTASSSRARVSGSC
jgi:septal ring-binding cell division protein DamX